MSVTAPPRTPWRLFTKILSTSSEEVRRRFTLDFLLVCIFLLALVDTSLNPITTDDMSPQFIALFIGIVLILGAVNHHISTTLAGTVFLLFITTIAAFSDSPQEVVQGRSLVAFTVSIVLASVLLRAWASFVFAGLSIGLVLWVAQSAQLEPNVPALLTFLIVATGSWLTAFTMEASLRQAQANNRSLQESESRYRAIWDNLGEGVGIVDEQERFLVANPAAHKIFGVAPGALIGQTLLPFLRPEDLQTVQQQTELRQQGQSSSYPLTILRPDGQTRRLLITATPLQLRTGEGAHTCGVFRDQTDWLALETILQRRTAALERIYTAGKQLGSTLKLEAVYDVTYTIIAQFMDCLDLFLSSYEPETQLIRCVHARHQGQPLDTHNFPPIPLEPEGRGTQSIAIRTGETLYLADYPAYWRTATIKYAVDSSGIVEGDEPLSDDIPGSALIVPLKVEGLVHGVIQVFSEHKDAYSADDRQVLEALAPQMAAAMANAWLYEQAQDELNERQRAEADTRQAYLQTEHLISAISSILIGVDDENRLIRWNAMAAQVFGQTATEMLGRPLFGCDLGWDWEMIWGGVELCRSTNEPIRLSNMAFRQPNGKTGILGLTLTPLVQPSSDLPGVLIVGSDITERLQLESQLAQAQKLESLGALAAGVAHEINTPTQYIQNNVQFLEDAFGQLSELMGHFYFAIERGRAEGTVNPAFLNEVDAAAQGADIPYMMQEIPNALHQAQEGLARVNKIVGAMREFSHPGTDEKVPTDINHAIESTIAVARHEWKYVAELETDLDQNLPPVPCLPAEFNQVVLNLLVNAAQAITEKYPATADKIQGVIRISTRQDQDWVEVRVRDNGVGIPNNIRARIFDPFFTTKPVGKGTGQGLTIAHNVITRKHGGTITFESQQGQGTTFIIRLPLQPTPALEGEHE